MCKGYIYMNTNATMLTVEFCWQSYIFIIVVASLMECGGILLVF